MSLKNQIQSALRNGRASTVGEIFDNVDGTAAYATIRARVYEMANRGELYRRNVRRDRSTGVKAATFSLRPAPVKASATFSF